VIKRVDSGRGVMDFKGERPPGGIHERRHCLRAEMLVGRRTSAGGGKRIMWKGKHPGEGGKGVK